jgi:hypothetical protein
MSEIIFAVGMVGVVVALFVLAAYIRHMKGE